MADKPALTGEELKHFIDSLEDAQLAVSAKPFFRLRISTKRDGYPPGLHSW